MSWHIIILCSITFSVYLFLYWNVPRIRHVARRHRTVARTIIELHCSSYNQITRIHRRHYIHFMCLFIFIHSLENYYQRYEWMVRAVSIVNDLWLLIRTLLMEQSWIVLVWWRWFQDWEIMHVYMYCFLIRNRRYRTACSVGATVHVLVNILGVVLIRIGLSTMPCRYSVGVAVGGLDSRRVVGPPFFSFIIWWNNKYEIRRNVCHWNDGIRRIAGAQFIRISVLFCFAFPNMRIPKKQS